MGVPLYTKVQKSVDSMVRIVREDAQGIRVIKALSKEDYENARFDKANHEIRRSETRAGIIMRIVDPVMTLLMNLGIVTVIAVSSYFVAKNQSSTSTVIAFMQYFTLISVAMMSLSRMFVMYTKCSASASRISLVMESVSELELCEDDGLGDPSVHVSFENVSFSYLGKKKNLKDISFSLKRGETLGIIGATPLIKRGVEKFRTTKAGDWILTVGEPVVQIALIVVITAYLVDGSFNPFLYFRF
jgi:ATP-binding cassette subfamily B protein